LANRPNGPKLERERKVKEFFFFLFLEFYKSNFQKHLKSSLVLAKTSHHKNIYAAA
jgi:hypothetical protein